MLGRNSHAAHPVTHAIFCVCVPGRIEVTQRRRPLGRDKVLVSQPPYGRLRPVSALGFTWGIPL